MLKAFMMMNIGSAKEEKAADINLNIFRVEIRRKFKTSEKQAMGQKTNIKTKRTEYWALKNLMWNKSCDKV